MEANPDAKRLYDDLLSNYNRLIRPVANNTETLTVRLGLKLSQLIEVTQRKTIELKARRHESMNVCFVPGEPEKSGDDDERLGGAKMDGL